jgi:hypothetical protein
MFRVTCGMSRVELSFSILKEELDVFPLFLTAERDEPEMAMEKTQCN